MNAMIALFALFAVASAVDYYGTGSLLHKNQRWNKDIWNGVGYGSVIGGYGVGLPQTYGQQIYGQSYYNPISYAYGVTPVSNDYTYGYVNPIYQQYGVHHLGSYGKTYGVTPVTHNTYASVQPIISKTITPVVEPQVHVQGKSFITQQPAFTSYFHRGVDNIVKPEISPLNVADVTYKTVQQPISYVTPHVQSQIVQPQLHVQPQYVQPQLHVQPQYVSSFKTVQEPVVQPIVQPLVSQYATGWQDASINYDVPKVSTYSSYEIPKVGVYNYEVPKVSSFSYSNTNSHVVEPKVTSTHTVTQEDYKK
jgi:hypothetical protein